MKVLIFFKWTAVLCLVLFSFCLLIHYNIPEEINSKNITPEFFGVKEESTFLKLAYNFLSAFIIFFIIFFIIYTLLNATMNKQYESYSSEKPKEFKRNFGFLTTWLNILCVLIISFSILIIFNLPKKSHLDILGYSIDQPFMMTLTVSAILSMTSLSFFNIFHLQKKFRAINHKDFLENCNAPAELSIEEKRNLLGEVNYIISKLEENIKNDPEKAWHWKIKLKSAIFTLNCLGDRENIEPSILTDDDKNRLNKKSPFLNLNEHGLKTKSDPSTVSSIKEKMFLYRKHRQEQI